MADHTEAVRPGMVDRMLDRSVAFGYSRVGYALRRRHWRNDPQPGELCGRRVLITGATSGIGLAAAEGVARLGAEVHMLGHSGDHLERAVTEVQRKAPDAALIAERCDMADLDDVRRFAADFIGRVPELHALVHNAGTMARQRTETGDGHEQTLATHVLGPHLLTGLLADALAADRDARVIFQSSGGMYGAPLVADDPEYRHGDYSGVTAYARTKRMQVVLAQLWADRLRDRGVAVHSTHPGWVDTHGVSEHLPRFRALTRPIIRPAEQGADTLVWLVAGPNRIEHAGAFWHDRRLRPTTYLKPARDGSEQRAEFWRFCIAATGQPAAS